MASEDPKLEASARLFVATTLRLMGQEPTEADISSAARKIADSFAFLGRHNQKLDAARPGASND